MYEGAIVAGKYRVEQVLGRGGMGVVVAATHVHLGTKVALKFLHEGVVTDQKVVARFLREARASAQLRSEHICRVSDFGMEGAVPYIVMELLEGTDLAKLVKARPLDIATAADYVIQACHGLAEAHAAQIIHRDLKPGNLFLTRRSSGGALVKVLDFGVAKAPEGTDFSLTQTSNVVGSPGFMSPEQLRSSRQVDARSDVWSLGVVLYKITSGRQPFKADALTDLAIAIAMDPVPPLPEVAPAFAAVVMRCLEKDPARRFQDVTSLAAALAPFTHDLRATTTYFAPEESFVAQQMSYGDARPALPFAEPRVTLIPDPPTTLQGASSVVDAVSPQPPQRSRMAVVAISALLVIGVGVGIGMGVGDSGTSVTPTSSPLQAAAPISPAVATSDPVVVAPPPPEVAPVLAAVEVKAPDVPVPVDTVKPAKPGVTRDAVTAKFTSTRRDYEAFKQKNGMRLEPAWADLATFFQFQDYDLDEAMRRIDAFRSKLREAQKKLTPPAIKRPQPPKDFGSSRI